MKQFLFTIFLISFMSSGLHAQLWKQYADSAKLYSTQKDAEKAIQFYTKAKEELLKDSAKSNSYAEICTTLGNAYFDLTKYDSAEKYFITAKDTREKISGKDNNAYAANCNSLGNVYVEIGDFKKAELYYLDAKNIREKILGNQHLDYGGSCNSLGNLYNDLGQYKKAELYYLEAKQIVEKVAGKHGPDYRMSCNNLGVLYAKMGEYEKAASLLLEAKEITAEVSGKETMDYGRSCVNLANLYSILGKFEKAEFLLLEAQQVGKTVGSKLLYEKSRVNLGILYKDMGQYKKSEFLYMEAKEDVEKSLGKDNLRYITACANLASLYEGMQQFEKAEDLFLEAKEITEKVLGKNSEPYTALCSNLGGLYLTLGAHQKAEAFFSEAKQIIKTERGEEHPAYAVVCERLGVLYTQVNEFEKAESHLAKAQSIIRKTLARQHPRYIQNCIDLANLYWNAHQHDKAVNLFNQAYKLQADQINEVFRFTSEKEKQAYLKTISNLKNYFFSVNFFEKSEPGGTSMYDMSLSRRNLILTSSQQLLQSINNSNDTSIQNKYNSWIDERKQLAFWYSKPISERPDYVKDLEEEANTLEKELTKISSAFKTQQSGNNINWQTIQQNLEPNEAAIEFVDFNFYDGKRYTDSTYYIALVLRKDKPGPQLIRLFEKKQLDSVLNSADNINTIYTENSSIYELTWKPLEKYLNGITKIYFAPAGDLFKISFVALPVDDKQVLSDKYQLVQLNTTVSVTAKNENFISASDKVQLYGGIEYNADTTQLKTVAAAWHSSNEISRSLPDDLERGSSIQYLPGSQEEVREIKQQADKSNTPVAILSGINATEESFKALNGNASPSVLHIATHGFFFPDPKQTDSIQRRFETSAKVFRQSDNPLFRSGLLFAGANNAWKGRPVSGIEDGIVTAYDVSNMYLPNTKLVVLSACETALGDIEGSEGVYGLQRAFKIAGAQNLVMSLWKVPDSETAEFMEVFYSNMFNHQSISDGFYHAQTTMKNKYRFEPVKWAAWILVR